MIEMHLLSHVDPIDVSVDWIDDLYHYDWDRDIARTRARLHKAIDARCNKQLRDDALRRLKDHVVIGASGLDEFTKAVVEASEAIKQFGQAMALAWRTL